MENEKFFNAFRRKFSQKLTQEKEVISSSVPSFSDSTVLRVNLVSGDDESILISVSGFERIVRDPNEINHVKMAILSIIDDMQVMTKKIRSTGNEIRLKVYKDSSLMEAVIKVFKRKGNSLVPTLKCIGGQKDGKRVSDAKICMQAPSYNRRVGAKKGSKKKGSIARSKNKTKVTNIVSRKRLSKANKRLKKARGF
jgi:hypothetical protein